MIDIQLIRDNPDLIKAATKSKGVDYSYVDAVLHADKQRRELLTQVEELRAQKNKFAKERNIEAGRKVKQQLHELEPKLVEIEVMLANALSMIPNPPAADVKSGKDESENEVIRKWGTPRQFAFPVRDHLKIGEDLGIVDVKRAAKVSGPRFAYLKGDGVLLEFALIQFALDTLLKEGFIPIIPPVLIKKQSMRGMGYLEHGGEADMFLLEKDDLILVGTSEQSIGPMHAGEILDHKQLPLRYLGFSNCFRREAGSYGKDTRGLIRLHQFDKIEMFSFTTPEKSDQEHEFMLEIEEKLFRALGIPYQVVKMCSGDLGAPAARKYDLEAWLPGQNKYREVTSTSNTTDFQSRRLNIKFQQAKRKEYVHMLNGTALAMSRTPIAILENYQNQDGSVTVPEVLKKYLGKEKITK